MRIHSTRPSALLLATAACFVFTAQSLAAAPAAVDAQSGEEALATDVAVTTKPAASNTEVLDVPLSAEVMRQNKWTGKWSYKGDDKVLSDAANLPVHVWTPVGQPARLVVLALHGLTLHGRSYEILARGFASGGAVFVAPDMRGYGMNLQLPDSDERSQIDNEKSYEDIVRLAQAMKKQYPNLGISALGESLGTSFAVKLAADHPELIDEVIVAAPTAKVNPLMFVHPRTIGEGVAALFRKGHKMSYRVFFNELVSDEPQIKEELAADPLVRKNMPLKALLKTQEFVGHTEKWAKKIKQDTPILVLQGSKDKAMVPRAVVDLTRNIDSTDQTIRWMTGYSHLLLETKYLRSASLDAIVTFIDAHDPDDYAYKEVMLGEMHRLGAADLQKKPE